MLCEMRKCNSQYFLTPTALSFLERINSYVLLYEDERKLQAALAIGIFGTKGIKDLIDEAQTLSTEQQQQRIADFINTEESDFELPDLPLKPEIQSKINIFLSELPEAERNDLIRQGILLWSGLFGSFFNLLSLMVHGEKLTALVPKAISGDDKAYLKAAHLDPFLLTHHPYFQKRKQIARTSGEIDFLYKLARREAGPSLRGKIRYPGLYVLFGCLEMLHWLDEFRHTELLDLCDQARLDRYQNRIEDVNYLTKRLREYRQFQKSGGLSMH